MGELAESKCTRLAATLDLDWIASVSPPRVRDEELPVLSGEDLAAQLHGRLLLRYLLPEQVGLFLAGSSDKHWVTPTAFSPTEAIEALALFRPRDPRTYVLALEPARIERALGPRQVQLGVGIEYVLPDGFPLEAVLLELKVG